MGNRIRIGIAVWMRERNRERRKGSYCPFVGQGMLPGPFHEQATPAHYAIWCQLERKGPLPAPDGWANNSGSTGGLLGRCGTNRSGTWSEAKQKGVVRSKTKRGLDGGAQPPLSQKNRHAAAIPWAHGRFSSQGPNPTTVARTVLGSGASAPYPPKAHRHIATVLRPSRPCFRGRVSGSRPRSWKRAPIQWIPPLKY